MSRIEEALEKAALMRAGLTTGAVRRSAEPVRREADYRREEKTTYEPPSKPAVVTANPLLVAANSPSSLVAEEYRKLKSVIVGVTQRDDFLNTLMVTSSFGGEGKSVTSLNLAVSLAQECDHTVLLIDADLRKPSLHQYLGIEPNVGLADCLKDGVDVGEALIKTGIGKLSLLPAGRRLENPAEMLSSQKMRVLLGEMKHRYPDRYLIIDTPPVLPVAETRSLSSLVDGIIFVVREGVPSEKDVREACSALGTGKIFGLVYNDSTFADRSHLYRYKYQSYGGTPDDGVGAPDCKQAGRDPGYGRGAGCFFKRLVGR